MTAAETYARFMIFRITEYYPSGGLSDCLYSLDNLEDAIEYYHDNGIFEGYIFDRIEGKIVYDGC